MGLGGCGGGAWREDCFVKDLVDILEKARLILVPAARMRRTSTHVNQVLL